MESFFFNTVFGKQFSCQHYNSNHGSSIRPVAGGVLGSLVFSSVVVALLCIRRSWRRYRIAPSSEEYLANQYPFPFTFEVSCFRDNFISDVLRLITPSSHPLKLYPTFESKTSVVAVPFQLLP